MKLRLFVYAIIVTMFSSCAYSAMQHESMNNKFMDVSPVPIRTWTVAIGTYLSTYQLFSDGNGRYCYLLNGIATIHQIKIYETTDSELKMISETGIRSSISNRPGNSLILISHGSEYSMKEDPGLGLANLDCQAKLKSLQ